MPTMVEFGGLDGDSGSVDVDVEVFRMEAALAQDDQSRLEVGTPYVTEILAFDGNDDDEVIAIDGWIFKLISQFDRFSDKVDLESCRG